MATAVLLLWPLITIALFAGLGPARGLIWSVVVGYLFLPENYNAFNFPIVYYEKFTVISFSILLATVMFHRRIDPDIRRTGTGFRNMLLALAFVVIVVSPIGTYLTNPEPLINGPAYRAGLRINDLLSDMADNLIRLIPFLLAARLLIRPEHHRELLVAMLVVGFAYTFLVLFERRMSPQLNLWIYGYFPHNWLQHTRGGGFRPLVFLRHGLWLGFFLFTVFIAALALSRDKDVRGRALLPFLGLWVLLVIFLSRNLGPTMLALALAPVILFLPFRIHALLASVLAVTLLVYPAIHDIMEGPLTRFLDFVGKISAERAQSFQARLENETELLARAMEKPLFGWGGWGRMRVINEFGIDTSLVDGAWIIQIGRYGWVGYIGFFALLALPVLFATRAARRKPISPAIAGMMVMTAGNFVYLIPNSTLNPIAFLMLGAMAAFAQYDVVGKTVPVDVSEPDGRQVARYTRFAHNKPPEQAARGQPQGSSPHRRAVSTPYSSRSRRKSGA